MNTTFVWKVRDGIEEQRLTEILIYDGKVREPFKHFQTLIKLKLTNLTAAFRNILDAIHLRGCP